MIYVMLQIVSYLKLTEGLVFRKIMAMVLFPILLLHPSKKGIRMDGKCLLSVVNIRLVLDCLAVSNCCLEYLILFSFLP